MLKLFRHGIEVDPEIDPTFINQYFTVLVEEYEALNVETDYFMSEYEFMASKMDQVTDEEAKTSFDALLIKSGAADCNSLENIFSERLANDPDNAAQIEKAFKLMARNNCQSEFFLMVGEKYYAIAPSTSIAQLLSKGFENAKNFDKAIHYLNEAIAHEVEPKAKANLCVQISGTELSAGASKEAATWAKQAIEYNGENGSAYLCLAQAYVDGATCEGFDKQTVFWLAYDLVAKARGFFEGNEAQQELCSSLLTTYRNYFPKQADCFFRGLQEGDAYTVNCGWVSGVTTVRATK
jgi:tetratricopeptide (TPR) repeat protein